jgi:hypothetical protein
MLRDNKLVGFKKSFEDFINSAITSHSVPNFVENGFILKVRLIRSEIKLKQAGFKIKKENAAAIKDAHTSFLECNKVSQERLHKDSSSIYSLRTQLCTLIDVCGRNLNKTINALHRYNLLEQIVITGEDQTYLLRDIALPKRFQNAYLSKEFIEFSQAIGPLLDTFKTGELNDNIPAWVDLHHEKISSILRHPPTDEHTAVYQTAWARFAACLLMAGVQIKPLLESSVINDLTCNQHHAIKFK